VVSKIGLFNIPNGIVVNTVSTEITSILTLGSLRMGIYSENGQTQETSLVFPSITAVGIVTKNVSSVVLSSGNYYYAITPIDGTFIVRTQGVTAPVIASSVLNKQQFQGTVSVAGGAIPTTFNPVTLPQIPTFTIPIRFDN